MLANALTWNCLVNKLKRGHNWKSGLPREGLTQEKFPKHSSNADSVCVQYKPPASSLFTATYTGSDYSTRSSKRTNFKGTSVLSVHCRLSHRHTQKTPDVDNGQEHQLQYVKKCLSKQVII